MENNGLKLEILKDENKDKESPASIYESSLVVFRLKVIDKTKRKSSCPMWPDNEEVEFAFDVDKDDPELIVKELKDKTNKIGDEDVRYLIQCIKDKCLLFRLEREDHIEEEGIIGMNTSLSHSSTATTQQPSQHNNTSVSSTHSNTLVNHSINATAKPSEGVPQQSVIAEESICNKTTNEVQQQNNQQQLHQQQQQQLIQKQHQDEQTTVDQAQADLTR
jgi:hypothetical protein